MFMLALYLAACHTSEAVTTVSKCSWRWKQKASETCRAILQLLINILPSCITLVLLYIYIYIIFMKLNISLYFRRSVEKIQVQLISYKNNGYFTWKRTYIYDNIFLNYSIEWEIFQTKFVQKIKTHIVCSITFFRKSCCLWDNVEKYRTARQAADGNIIRRMRMAWWLTMAIDIHWENVIRLGFAQHQWLWDRAEILHLYV